MDWSQGMGQKPYMNLIWNVGKTFQSGFWGGGLYSMRALDVLLQ